MWNSLIHPLFVVDPDRYTGLYMRQPGTVQSKPERREIPDTDLFIEAKAVREREELADQVTALEAEVKRLDALKGGLQKLLDNALNTIDILTEQNGALEVEVQKSRETHNHSTGNETTRLERLLDTYPDDVVFWQKTALNLAGVYDDLYRDRDVLRAKVRQQGRGEVEIYSLVQDLPDPKWGDTSEADQQLTKHINAGSEILDISSSTIWDPANGDVSHHRIVTLKRAKSAPAPQPERTVVREAVPVESNNRVFAGHIVEDIEPEGDPLLNEMERGRIVQTDLTFSEALRLRREGKLSTADVQQIGDLEAINSGRAAAERLREVMQTRPQNPVPRFISLPVIKAEEIQS